MNEPIKFYSDYVCIDCGKKYGKPRGGMTTSHTDICGICRKKKSLCHQRNYGWFLTEKNGFIFGGKKK